MIQELNDFFDHVHSATWVVILGFIGSAIAGAWKIRKEFKPLIKDIRDFFADWKGMKARPGFPGYKGAMERIADIEHEVKANGGGSIKDQVNRLEANQQIYISMINKISSKLGIEEDIEPVHGPPRPHNERKDDPHEQ